MVFTKDYTRYKKEVGCVLYEPSILVVCLYRIRKSISKLNILFRIPCSIIIAPVYMFLTLLLGIHIPKSCVIGPGLLIHHFGGVILNPQTRIGANCTLRHNVTIGNRHNSNDVPTLGDNVEIGTGAVILGNIHIGNNVTIGANAVVLKDVPDNNIAVGVPAKNYPKK